MKIVIVGAGAVGGVVAAVLKNKGYDIQIVARPPELAMKIQREGIHASGYWLQYPTWMALMIWHCWR